MKIRTLIIPAAAALLSAGGLAFAQTPQPATPPEAPAAEKPAEPAPEQVDEGQAQAEETAAGEDRPDPVAVAEKAAADAKTAAATAPPRSPEQAAIAKRIADSAPKREWRTVALSPAQKGTVMYPQDAKKVSDVSLIASVDQVNRLEMLDITGESTSDTLRVPTGPAFVNETQTADAAGANPEAGGDAGSTSPAPENTDAAASTEGASAPDAGAPVGAAPASSTTESAPPSEPQE